MVKRQRLASPTAAAAADIPVKYFTLMEAGFSHTKKQGLPGSAAYLLRKEALLLGGIT